MVGVGVYVLVGIVVRECVGLVFIIFFLIVGIVVVFVVFCYVELFS